MSNYRIDTDIEIPMRDGVVLRADLWRPGDADACPVVLMRTPYDKRLIANIEFVRPEDLVRAGFAVVIQDTRGRFASDGEWQAIMWTQEGLDGYDTVEWIAAQPWCTGAVGMAGLSYLAITQIYAALQHPPALKAIAPVMASLAQFDQVETGGGYRLDHLFSWLLFTGADWLQGKLARGEPVEPNTIALLREALLDPNKPISHRPLRETPHLSLPGFPVSAADLFDRKVDSGPADVDLDAIAIPCLHIGGWYDIFQRTTVGMFQAFEKNAGRDGNRLIMGPWTHAGHLPACHGEKNFGIAATGRGTRIAEAHIDFFRKHLRGDDVASPKVRYFLMNAGEMRNAETWPPVGIASRTLYLHNEKTSGTKTTGGALTAEAPARDEPPAHYTYDPSDPTPTRGGRVLSLGQLAMGPLDQGVVERRDDVLTYTSGVLDHDTDIVGRVVLKLFVSSSAPDTDFVARLCDVDPVGISLPFAEGMIRARYRNGFDAEVPLQPGEVTELAIDLGDTAWRLRGGHRLRLNISSANYPHIDPNMNTGAPAGSDRDCRVADNAVHCGPVMASSLSFDVLDEGSVRQKAAS